MRKLLIFALLLTLVAMLTGCVDSERCWTLPLEDGFEVWCENGERMLVRETGTFRYAFVVRNIEALRVEDNFILTRGGGESYTFVETATGAVARTASGEDGFRAVCEALGLDADGAWTALDSRPEAAVDAWHHLYDAITPRELAVVTSAFGGYADGELPEPLEGLYMNSHGGFHGDGATFAELRFAPEDGEAVERLLEDSGWLPLPATGAGRFLYGRQTSRRDLLHGRSGPHHAGGGKRLVALCGHDAGRLRLYRQFRPLDVRRGRGGAVLLGT